MAEVIEAGIGTITTAAQTAKGAAPNFALTARPADRPKWVDGVLSAKKTLYESDYLDGRVFGSPSVGTKSVNGEVGNLVIQAEPANVGIYPAYILAVDTVTGAADPWTHTSTSDAVAAQKYMAWCQIVGQNIAPQKHIFSDAKIGQLTMSSTSEALELLFDMKINALKSAVTTTAPAKTENGEDPYYHTETDGQVTVDGTAICEVKEQIVTIDRKQTIEWGNAIKPCQIVDGKGEITSTIKAIATDQTVPILNKLLFNTATPADTTEPVATVYYVGINRKYVRSASRSFEIQTPRVEVKPDDMVVTPNRAGGSVELVFSGRALRSGATPALTTITKSGDSAAYV